MGKAGTPPRPPPLGPVAGLLPEPLLDAGAQRLLVVQPVEPLQDSALVGLVLVPTRVNLGDERVEVGVSAQRAPGDQLLPAGGALFVPGGEERFKNVNKVWYKMTNGENIGSPAPEQKLCYCYMLLF